MDTGGKKQKIDFLSKVILGTAKSAPGWNHLPDDGQYEAVTHFVQDPKKLDNQMLAEWAEMNGDVKSADILREAQAFEGEDDREIALIEDEVSTNLIDAIAKHLKLDIDLPPVEEVSKTQKDPDNEATVVKNEVARRHRVFIAPAANLNREDGPNTDLSPCARDRAGLVQGRAVLAQSDGR